MRKKCSAPQADISRFQALAGQGSLWELMGKIIKNIKIIKIISQGSLWELMGEDYQALKIGREEETWEKNGDDANDRDSKEHNNHKAGIDLLLPENKFLILNLTT